MASETSEPDAQRELLVTRLLNAPCERVWQALTDPDALGRWWGPQGFSITTHAFALQPGGAWRFTMHGPDGTDYPNLAVFSEIVPPQHLRFSYGSGEPHDPSEFQVTITVTPEGDGARISLHSLFPTPAERERVISFGAVESANQSLDKLEAVLSEG